MWYIVLALLALVYLLLNTVFVRQGSLGIYLLGPILWILLALVCLLLSRQDGLTILKFKRVRRWYLGNSPQQAGLLIGGFQVALLIIVGLFAGFGKSPYSFAPPALLRNIFFVGSMLLGMEISRAYLIKRGVRKKRYTTLTLGLTTLVFVFIQISPTQLTNLLSADTVKILEFIGKILITSISINLLACYLSYMGGATASMAYVGSLFALEWFSPVLPDPHWTLLALIGTIVPGIGFVILQNSIQEPGEKKKRHHKKKGIEQGWTAVVIFSVILVFFSFGYLGVQPTVIYSGSMNPELEVGDIAIINSVDVSDIKVGDVIQFVAGNKTLIIHRVVERYEDEQGQLFFVTQGDANKNPDPEPLFHKNVRGIVAYSIPKLGWIQIYTTTFFRSIITPQGG